MMTTYYQDQSVLITPTTIRVDGRSFPLPELSRVWHRRGAPSWRALAGRGAIGLGMLVPLVLAALGIALGVWLDASMTFTIAMVGGAILVGLAVGPVADVLLEHLDRSYARGAHRYEIWAVWRGTPIVLVDTRDQIRFGQIYRALQRALEHSEPPPVRGPAHRARPTRPATLTHGRPRPRPR